MRSLIAVLSLFALMQISSVSAAKPNKKTQQTVGQKYKTVVAHYKVEQDDTLNTISIRLYGTTKFGAWIYLWNKDQLKNMNDLAIGMNLKLKKPRIFSKEAGDNQLFYYYRKKFGLTGPPQIARASVGTIQELPQTIPVAPPETALAVEEEKKKAVDEDPTAENVLKGEEHLKQNNLAEAKAEFAEARSDDPTNPTPRILEISTLLRMGNEAEAKDRAKDLIDQDKEFCDLPIIRKLAESSDCP